jgi:two-component system, NarL family, invasion response regulator UvrY
MNQYMAKTKIAVADDHRIFRNGIINLLDPDRYELLFDVSDGRMLIEKIGENESMIPDIIIMDIEMPGMNGYEAVAWLKSNHPGISVLVLSVVDQEESIVRMIKLGVKGYLSKVLEPEELYAALRAIINGDYYFPHFVTNILLHNIQNEDSFSAGKKEFLLSHEKWDSLNDGQKEFVRHACTDMVYGDIADLMCVSIRTIDGYRDQVFKVFNVKNRVGLVLYALRNRIVTI